MPATGITKPEFPEPDKTLKISEKVIRIFRKYEQKEGLYEAGGVLLGNVAKDYVEITDVTIPNRFDLRHLFSFVRDCA